MWGKIRRRLSGTATLTALLIAAILVLAWLAPSSDPPKQGAAAPAAKLFPGEFRGPTPEDVARAMEGPGAPARSFAD